MFLVFCIAYLIEPLKKKGFFFWGGGGGVARAGFVQNMKNWERHRI